MEPLTLSTVTFSARPSREIDEELAYIVNEVFIILSNVIRSPPISLH